MHILNFSNLTELKFNTEEWLKFSYVGSELGETAATPENESVLDLPLLFQLTNYLKIKIVTYGLPTYSK